MTMRSIQERMNDVLLFLLAQNEDPDADNWLDALDDLFGELSVVERLRLAEICDDMLAGVRHSLQQAVR